MSVRARIIGNIIIDEWRRIYLHDAKRVVCYYLSRSEMVELTISLLDMIFYGLLKARDRLRNEIKECEEKLEERANETDYWIIAQYGSEQNALERVSKIIEDSLEHLKKLCTTIEKYDETLEKLEGTLWTVTDAKKALEELLNNEEIMSRLGI